MKIKIIIDGKETELLKVNRENSILDIGSSFAVVIPMDTIKQAGVGKGDKVQAYTDYKRYVLFVLKLDGD